MTAVLDIFETKQTFKIPAENLIIETPEPFYFVVKMGERKFTDEQLHELDAANEHLRIETNSEGDFEVMPPPFPEKSRRNSNINLALGNWAKEDDTGVCFESSAKRIGGRCPEGIYAKSD